MKIIIVHTVYMYFGLKIFSIFYQIVIIIKVQLVPVGLSLGPLNMMSRCVKDPE